jgi:hypothetical protein
MKIQRRHPLQPKLVIASSGMEMRPSEMCAHAQNLQHRLTVIVVSVYYQYNNV